jgi:hypothetical protein
VETKTTDIGTEALGVKKKYLWFRFPTDPIFSGWLRAAAKMASVVTLIIEKTMKKIFKKKIISDLPILIFSRYETGTTGIFFYALGC